jgi:hypothetical protein
MFVSERHAKFGSPRKLSAWVPMGAGSGMAVIIEILRKGDTVGVRKG